MDCAVDFQFFLEKEASCTTLLDDNQFWAIEIASKLSESSEATTTLGGVCAENLLYTVKTREEMESVIDPTGPYDFLASAFALMEQEKLIPSSDEEIISGSSDDLMIIPSDEALVDWSFFYKLGSLIVHACYSANSGASELVSTQEATKLFSGVTSSNDHHAFATLWGCKQNLNGTYTIGGEQKTKFIYNVSLGPDWLPL